MAASDKAAGFPLADIAAAFTLLTRLPVHHLGRTIPQTAFVRGVWAYPLAGAAIGALGGMVAMAASAAHLPPAFGAVAAIAAMVLLTGGLHEDGAADTADGLGGGATRERKLAIMRDSRIGSYGAIALILAIFARLAAIATLTHPAAGLAAAAALGRAAMLVPMLLLAPARSDGMAARLGRIAPAPALAGLAIAAAAAFALLPAPTAAAALGATAIAALAMTALARKQLGGITGDILGATCVLAECLVLAALAR